MNEDLLINSPYKRNKLQLKELSAVKAGTDPDLSSELINLNLTTSSQHKHAKKIAATTPKMIVNMPDNRTKKQLGRQTMKVQKKTQAIN